MSSAVIGAEAKAFRRTFMSDDQNASGVYKESTFTHSAHSAHGSTLCGDGDDATAAKDGDDATAAKDGDSKLLRSNFVAISNVWLCLSSNKSRKVTVKLATLTVTTRILNFIEHASDYCRHVSLAPPVRLSRIFALKCEGGGKKNCTDPIVQYCRV